MGTDIEELKKEIQASSLRTKVYVGCDSQRRKGDVKYVTVVILHIDGNKGGKLFSFIDKEKDYSNPLNPKYRLIQEAYKAVGIAEQIIEAVGPRDFEIHLDLNSNPEHKSHLAVKEAIGYVLGVLGLKAKIKPHAWVASCCADRYSK
jgi:predicted RNase H-related nuclease YkuK (DUF458 family)